MNFPSFDRHPRAIAVDLDGTLLNSQTQLSERNRRAIVACFEYRIPVVIATSRPARTVRRVIGDELANGCSLVLMNGALAIAAPPLSGLVKETIKPSLAKDIIDIILSIKPEIRITIEVEGYWFSTNKPRDTDELWKVNAATPDMQLPLDAALADNPAKIAAGGLARGLSAVAAAVSQQFGDTVSVVPANDNTFLNITSAKATKPNALKRLLASQRISLKEVMAFGDDIPDIEMLSECGIPVAVANAFPEVKSVCDYQTTSNDEDGVAIVLEKMLSTFGK